MVIFKPNVVEFTCKIDVTKGSNLKTLYEQVHTPWAVTPTGTGTPPGHIQPPVQLNTPG